MARNGKLRRMSEDETELNMVPIMNMFMVLIPFLLMSASFFQIKAINTSIPVHAESKQDEEALLTPEVKVTLLLAIHEDQMTLSAMSNQLDQSTLSDMETTILKPDGSEHSNVGLVGVLEDIKARYPASDTIVIIPDPSVLYDDIIQTMDLARNQEKISLFPNVVLSGSLG